MSSPKHLPSSLADGMWPFPLDAALRELKAFRPERREEAARALEEMEKEPRRKSCQSFNKL